LPPIGPGSTVDKPLGPCQRSFWLGARFRVGGLGGKVLLFAAGLAAILEHNV